MVARKICIGLTGRMASGKGEAVRILKEHGFQYTSLSDIVRREAEKEKGDIDRGRMQDVGNRLRSKGGAGVLGRMVREKIAASAESRWVIDGIRNPAEVLELRNLEGFSLVAIESRVEVILERMRRRGRVSDALGEQELRAVLEREWGCNEPAGGQQVGPTVAMADFTVFNDGTLAELKDRLTAVLKEIGVAHD